MTQGEGQVCVANIGRRQRRARLGFGVVMALAAVAWIAAVQALGLAPVWRIPVFLPAWLAALGILQHREST